jgi:hypothetical protein
MRALSPALGGVLFAVACSGSAPPAPPSPAPRASAGEPPSSATSAPVASSPLPEPPVASSAAIEPDEPPDPPLDVARGGTIAGCKLGACAVTAGHRVVCWGMGAHNEAYHANPAASRAPRVIAGVKHVQRIACDYQYACAIHTSGEVSCWGALGAGDGWKGTGTPLLTKVPGVTDAVGVGVAPYQACLLTRGGELACWWMERPGAKVSPLQRLKSGVTRMSLSSGALCAIDERGGVSCAGGAGTNGSGAPLTEWSDLPALGPAIDVSATTPIACTVKRDGRLACEVGNPKLKKGAEAIRDARRVWIGNGGDFACALVGVDASGGGQLRCWGKRYTGQLGDGTVSKELTSEPVVVKIPERVVDAALESAAACARTVSGKVYCWGANGEGEAGVPWGLDPMIDPTMGVLEVIPREVQLP